LRGLRLDLLKSQESTPEQFAEVKENWIAEVQPLCGKEAVSAAGMFRQGGASATQAAGRAGQMLGGMAGQMLSRSAAKGARNKRAGGLPERVLLAVTPSKLYAFDYSFQTSRSGRERRDGKPTEAASWDRAGVSCVSGKSGTMTTLTIESPDGELKATLVGGTTADDPWSQDVMQALGALPAPA
jgi:hypothetical protein